MCSRIANLGKNPWETPQEFSNPVYNTCEIKIGVNAKAQNWAADNIIKVMSKAEENRISGLFSSE